ncbi:hypothetical protein GCM10022254_09770 [Actinomadura meridiana]|uniref:Uncharacterized protein n=1 Tax=Actinomadura meridiana TaxID=559626 RepID=A0ABP8BTR8_9ACTN
MQKTPPLGQWIHCRAHHDPVKVVTVQDTLTGTEVLVRTIRGDDRTIALDDLGEWEPAAAPDLTAPTGTQRGQQEALFAERGTDKYGNQDLFS